MGNTPTKPKASNLHSVSTAVSNIISKSISKCMIQSKQSQNMNFTCDYSAKELLDLRNSPACLLALKISGDNPDDTDFKSMANATCDKCYYANNSQDMQLTVDAKCDITAAVTDEIHDSIRNDLKQKVDIKEDSLGGIFGGGEAGPETKTLVETALIKNITTETISEAITQVSQLQVMTASNSTSIGNSQKMIGSVIFSAMMKNEKFNKAIAEVVNVADQSVKIETTNPFSTLVKTVGGVVNNLLTLPGQIIKFVLVIIFVYLLYTNGVIKATPPEEDLEKFAKWSTRRQESYDEDRSNRRNRNDDEDRSNRRNRNDDEDRSNRRNRNDDSENDLVGED
jgi:hypothetical protein